MVRLKFEAKGTDVSEDIDRLFRSPNDYGYNF